MLIEEQKRTVSMHPITLIVCFVCLIGVSVAATYLIVRAEFQNQLNGKDRRILNIRKNYEALAQQNSKLMESLRKWEDEYSKLETRYEAMEPTTEQKYMQTAPELTMGSKQMLVLKPTWVSSGETTLAFDGNLRIILHEASRKDECPRDSAAVSYLTSDSDKKELCLRTGRPDNFTYQGKNYLLNLSGIVAKAGVYRYCISISQTR